MTTQETEPQPQQPVATEPTTVVKTQNELATIVNETPTAPTENDAPVDEVTSTEHPAPATSTSTTGKAKRLNSIFNPFKSNKKEEDKKEEIKEETSAVANATTEQLLTEGVTTIEDAATETIKTANQEKRKSKGFGALFSSFKVRKKNDNTQNINTNKYACIY